MIAWFNFTTFQILLLGMMLMMTVISLVYYLSFRILSSGLRLIFNLLVISGVLVLGNFQAGGWNLQHYYVVTNLIALSSLFIYARLLCLGLDMQLYDPQSFKTIHCLWQYMPLLVLAALAVDLVLETFAMGVLVSSVSMLLLYLMGRLRPRNARLPFYVHNFMWGAAVLLIAAIITFTTRFLSGNLSLDNQIIAHSLLLPALSLEFATFSAGDMLRQYHAIRMRDRLLDEVRRVREDMREQKLLSLAHRLNTHTMANVMNRIQHALVKHDATVAMNLVHDYSEFLRSILQLNEGGSHQLQDEIDLLKRYLDLNKLQIGPKFSYRIQLNANPELPVPCMICLPAVENAIIHGFSDGLTEKPHIDIRFTQEPELLMAAICDNGRGLPENIHSEKRFGLQNTRKRLALLSEKTGIEYVLNLQNHNDDAAHATSGACLTIGIPIFRREKPNLQHKENTT
jgi:sensor histidine kinase YesM